MKLATLKDGSRDGQLIVVSRDLRTAEITDAIAPTLQRALDDWPFYAPQLTERYDARNQGRARRAFAFEPKDCMAPLPRAYQWADGSDYVNRVELGEHWSEGRLHRPMIVRWNGKKVGQPDAGTDMVFHFAPAAA